MNRHNIFRSPLRPILMMMIGLNCILQDLYLSVLLGIGIYAAAAGIELLFDRK